MTAIVDPYNGAIVDALPLDTWWSRFDGARGCAAPCPAGAIQRCDGALTSGIPYPRPVSAPARVNT